MPLEAFRPPVWLGQQAHRSQPISTYFDPANPALASCRFGCSPTGRPSGSSPTTKLRTWRDRRPPAPPQSSIAQVPACSVALLTVWRRKARSSATARTRNRTRGSSASVASPVGLSGNPHRALATAGGDVARSASATSRSGSPRCFVSGFGTATGWLSSSSRRSRCGGRLRRHPPGGRQ